MTVATILCALSGGYFATTLVLWLAHWFSHRSWSPLHGFHVLGHHRLYPDAERCLSERFAFAAGWNDSIYAFLPWIALEVAAMWSLFRWEIAAILTAEAALLIQLFSYIHAQFHVRASPLRRSKRFRRARECHFVHHQREANFAVLDHFWDYMFGTFVAPERVTRVRPINAGFGRGGEI